MSSPRTLRVWGVPEHFNYPWALYLQQQQQQQQQPGQRDGVEVSWRDCKGGTGEMVAGLRAGEADVALLLTEGAVKAAVESGDVRVVGLYVASPLVWGVHVGAKAKVGSGELGKWGPDGVRFAISRRGSGSHLMAFVLARKMGWDVAKLRFVEVGTIDKARVELGSNDDLVFLWEKAMTHPFVQAGELRRVGEIPTPWPCFVIAANSKALVTKADAIARVVAQVRRACVEFKKNRDASIAAVVSKFGLEKQTATEWFDAVEFACTPTIKTDVLKSAYDALAAVGQLPASPPGGVVAAVNKLVAKL